MSHDGMALAANSNDFVLTSRRGNLGHIRLNRPKALNSLTIDMVTAISDALDEFETDPSVTGILLDGEGPRGFCAGGDIRAIYESGRRQDGMAESFWRSEYVLNARIASFPKPFVAIMDGITMGGGVGLAAHASHRVVTDRSKVAMPEVGIGFVPDVGGTWLLSRGPTEFGTYLALTGEVIGAGDAIYAGLADVMVPSDRLQSVSDALASLRPGALSSEIEGVLLSHSQPVDSEISLQQHQLIDRCFAHESVESIIASLQEAGESARSTLDSLLTKSPTALKVTLRLLRLARSSSSLEECLLREYRAGIRFLDGHDFYEGIRAAVIDKDRRPQWQPRNVALVSHNDVEAYITPEIADAPQLPPRKKG